MSLSINSYKKAFDYLMSNEGSKFVNDPDDHGGPTKYGITQKSFSVYLKREASIADMEEMTKDQAADFYMNYFWMPMRLNELNNEAVATVLLDSGVNQGPGTAIKMAQKAVGVKEDGASGPLTITAINSVQPDEFIKKFHSEVLGHYTEIVMHKPDQEKFMNGWTNRAAKFLTLIA